MGSLGLIYGDIFATSHKPWRPHPENPLRIKKALRAITRYGLKNIVSWYKPIRVDVDSVKKVHAKGYVDYIIELSSKAPAEVDPDTYITSDTLEAALYAFGSAIHYSRNSVEKKENYFLLIRPPGHHVGIGGKALGAPTQGFCIFNNVAGAAKYLIEDGFDGIVILDFDVHHGNGTQEIFYKNNEVLFISIHQDPETLYPFSSGFVDEIGVGKGEGYNVNIPLPPMTADDCYYKVIDFVFELIREYSPEIVLVSAGFDGYKGDGIAELLLTSNTFYRLGEKLRLLGKPVTCLLEGGYNPGLERGLPAFIAGLLGVRNPIVERETKSLLGVCDRVEDSLSKLRSILRKYWSI